MLFVPQWGARVAPHDQPQPQLQATSPQTLVH